MSKEKAIKSKKPKKPLKNSKKIQKKDKKDKKSKKFHKKTKEKKKQGVKRKVDWKEEKTKFKKRKKESKAKKPHSEVSSKLESCFSINFQKMKRAQRIEKVGGIVKGVKGGLKFVITRKGMSRALILLLKYGSNQDRAAIAGALKGAFADICKDARAYHAVIKMLEYCDEETKKKICVDIVECTIPLSNNRQGSMVLDRIIADPDLLHYRKLILQQLYSKMYKDMPLLDGNGNPLSLKEIFEKQPDQKPFILETLKKYLENALSKTPSLIVVQVVLYEYLQHCGPLQRSSMTDLLPPVALQLLTCREGCLALVKAVDFASAKQRKKLLQAFKEHIIQLAQDKDSVLILLRILDVTDDTVLLGKIILSQVLANLEDVAGSKHGRLLLLHILAPRAKRYFKPHLLEHLPEPLTAAKHEQFNSKKEHAARNKELLAKVLPALEKLVQARVGAMLLAEEPLFYSTLRASREPALFTAVAQHCAENPALFDHHRAHRKIRGLVELCPDRFVSPLIDALSEDQIQTIAETRGSIVLARCLQKGTDAVKKGLKKTLKGLRKKLKASENKNAKILCEAAGF